MSVRITKPRRNSNLIWHFMLHKYIFEMLKYPNLHIDLYQSIFLVEWWIYLPAQCSFKPLAILIIHDNSNFSEEKNLFRQYLGLFILFGLAPYYQLWYKNEYFNIFPGGNFHQRNILKVMQVIMIRLVDEIPSFSQYILHINGVCENFATAFKVLLIISIRCMLNNLH